MIRHLYRSLDRMTIRAASALMAQPDGRDLRVDAVEEWLRTLDKSAPSIPAQVTLQKDGRFKFPTPRPCDHPVNNIVPGRLYRAGADWTRQPVILMLHGWNDALDHKFYFPRYARQFNRAGLNAATLQLPWHFERRPSELGKWGNFLGPDVARTMEATWQAVMETRALVGWLYDQGCPFVGLWGVSLGAWITGLVICHDDRIGAAVLSVPLARLDLLVAEAQFCAPIRTALQSRPVSFDKLNLVHNRPRIPLKNILLVEARYDLFMPEATVEDLWRAWGEPEIWRFPHSHISILGARSVARKTQRWLELQARAAKQTDFQSNKTATVFPPPG